MNGNIDETHVYKDMQRKETGYQNEILSAATTGSPTQHTYSYSQSNTTYLQPVHSGLECLDLRSSVGSVHAHVLGAHNGLAKDGDLLQLLLGHKLVVAPPDRGPDEGDVHPTVVVANEHGGLVLLVEIQQDVAILHPGEIARQSQEAGAPNVAEENGQSTLGVELAAGNEVEQLRHRECDEPNQSQGDRGKAVIYSVRVQRTVLCIEGQRSALRTDQLLPLLSFPALAVDGFSFFTCGCVLCIARFGRRRHIISARGRRCRREQCRMRS